MRNTTSKNFGHYLIVLVLSITAVCVGHAADLKQGEEQGKAESFFIAPDGDDANPGTEQAPFATLEAARDAIRKLKKDSTYPVGGVTVTLKGGFYSRAKPFELGPEDSGLPGAPVVYQSQPGAPARLVGGQRIPWSAFEPVTDLVIQQRIVDVAARDRIVQVNLGKLGITDFGTLMHQGDADFSREYNPSPLEVFVDGEPMQLARYPNVIPEHPLQSVIRVADLEFEFDGENKQPSYRRILLRGWESSRARYWQNEPDLWVSGCLVKPYQQMQRKLAATKWDLNTTPGEKIHDTYSQNTTVGSLTLAEPLKLWVGYDQREVVRFHILNALADLDAAGEYYLDRDSGILYLYPPLGWNHQSEVVVSLLNDVLVALEGCNQVIIRGLMMDVTRSSAVYIEGGQDNRIEDCVIRNTGVVGIQFGRGVDKTTGDLIPRKPGVYRSIVLLGEEMFKLGRDTALNRNAGSNNGVANCHIYNTAQGGVLLGGGDRKTLTPAGNYVENCNIHDVNRWISLYSEQIVVDGVGNLIRHNRLHGNDGGILYFLGNDHVAEYNEISGGLQACTDGGAVEIRQNATQLGNVLRYNYLHHNGRSGEQPGVTTVYLDNVTHGFTIHGNVFHANQGYNIHGSPSSPIGVNGGNLHVVSNNIFVNNGSSNTIGEGLDFKKITDYLIRDRRDYAFKHVQALEPPYRERYPEFARLVAAAVAGDDTVKVCNQVTTNLLVGPGDFGPGRYPDEPFRTGNVQRSSQQEVGFLNPGDGNFGLRDDASVYRESPDFKRVPFERMGRLCPGQNSRPNLDGTRDVPISPILRWAPAYRAVAHEVYLAPDRQAVERADVVVRQDTVTSSEYRPVQGLTPETTYYWRVDGRLADGTILPGKVWSFKTASLPQ